MVLQARLQRRRSQKEHINFMLMEKLGYLLWELPFLLLILWSAVTIIRWRRARQGRLAFDELDRRVLFGAARYRPDRWHFYPRFVLAVVAIAFVGGLQIIVLAPLGAAIATGVFILTSAAIVHGTLFL
jgi:hypothetical protein